MNEHVPRFLLQPSNSNTLALRLGECMIAYVEGESLFYYLYDDDEERAEVFAWCLDQFGPTSRHTWMHDSDAVFISPTNFATAFRVRWC